MGTQLRSARSLIVLALLLGIFADRLFTGRSPGISAIVWVAASLAALGWLSARERRPPTRANVWLAGAALLLAGCLALRVTPVLVLLNGVAVAGLLVLLVAHYRGPAVFEFSVFHLVGTWFQALLRIAGAAPLPAAQALRSLPLRRAGVTTALPVARGFVLAVPVVLGFGGLLMSADQVFASYVSDTFTFRLPFDTGSLINHTFVALVVAWVSAGGMLVAISGPPASTVREILPAEGDTQRLYPRYVSGPLLGFTEAVTVLVLVDLLFGTFMLVQGAYFFGGLDSLDRTGMTYADYARRGFFELVTVACLALALLGSLALATRRATAVRRHGFNGLSLAMVALVLGMLVSAFQRMLLYEEAYGFTRLRVYTHSFMIWLAAVLVLYGVALLLDRAKVFVWGAIIAALLYLAGLNVANPDALIARANIERYQVSGALDDEYLASLSADATPVVRDSLVHLGPDPRANILHALRLQREALLEQAAAEGWPAWNLARARALAALETVPPQ